MSTGPPPSQLILLSDLGSMEKGTKVRFLGCVETYDVPNGALVVKHSYPPGAPVDVACVNIDHARDTLHHTDLLTGAWLNIMGYVGEKRRMGARVGVHVQAVVVRPAGDLRLGEYEKALNARKKCDIPPSNVVESAQKPCSSGTK